MSVGECSCCGEVNELAITDDGNALCPICYDDYWDDKMGKYDRGEP
jgi:hypothetical protein